MPRVSRVQADQHRLAIEKASARLFRERGLHGVSVAELMAAAGLTHGGFYGHFASKEALAAQACTRCFQQSRLRWRERIAAAGSRAAAHADIVNAYLSPRSRDAAGSACPLPALAGDVAREPAGAPLRARFREGIAGLLGILAGLQPVADGAQAHADALVELSTLAGALLLARATAGDALSDQFLAAARHALTARSGS